MGGQNTSISYLRPREKAVRSGVAALSDRELIQIIIGSGSYKHTVARISKRVVGLLKQHGAEINYEQLMRLPGVGTARSLQLVAVFEIASRYPINLKSPPLLTQELIVRQTKSSTDSDRIWAITMDGAKRLISQRTLLLSQGSPSILRDVTNFLIHDNASHLAVVRYSDKLAPSMSDLSIARDIHRISQLIGISSVDYILCNDVQNHSIMKEATYAA